MLLALRLRLCLLAVPWLLLLTWCCVACGPLAHSSLPLACASGPGSYLEAEGMEKTYKFTQRDIRDHVDLSTASNAVDFKLPHFGPYSVSYGRSGRHMLLGGQKGHIAAVDCLRKSIVTEFNVQEAVRSVCFLHNETLFAVAQKKYVYIYDNSGLEIHCMREHSRVQHMQFLPYHFLLTTIGDGGVLQYRDTSTGKLVASHRTKLGPCPSMAQNPHNAVIHTGHNNGTVGLWSPTVGTPLVKMMCHKGPVRALDVDLAGRVMVTAGADGQMKVWDLRMLRLRHAYFTPTPASSVCISQRGLLAVSFGPHVQIWQDALEHKAKSPYMNHSLPGSVISSAQFRPYEDILGIGYDQGLCNMVVPGSGEPNFDSFVANPFETKKQVRNPRAARRHACSAMLACPTAADTTTPHACLYACLSRSRSAVRGRCIACWKSCSPR